MNNFAFSRRAPTDVKQPKQVGVGKDRLIACKLYATFGTHSNMDVTTYS